jgi:hypothetical protein
MSKVDGGLSGALLDPVEDHNEREIGIKPHVLLVTFTALNFFLYFDRGGEIVAFLVLVLFVKLFSFPRAFSGIHHVMCFARMELQYLELCWTIWSQLFT